MKNVSLKKVVLSAIVISAWVALTGQLYLILHNRVESVPQTILRYFTFFTILTNFLIAVWSTQYLFKNFGVDQTDSTQKYPAALTVYIAVVGLVYNTILRFLWSPAGFQLVVDELLHSVIPILFIFFLAEVYTKR